TPSKPKNTIPASCSHSHWLVCLTQPTRPSSPSQLQPRKEIEITRFQTQAVLVLLATLLTLSTTRSANAADPIRVGTMTVQRHGDHGTALILIPGLASGGWVWDDAVAALTNDHVLYVVTLAGFDGIPPA